MVKKKNKNKSEKVKRRKALQGIIVATYYEEGPIKEMIHNFKYNHALELKKVLSNLLVQAYQCHCEHSGVIASSSAAIHDSKIYLRGYFRRNYGYARNFLRKYGYARNFLRKYGYARNFLRKYRSPRLLARDDNIIVTFTPLHRRRLAERGFNQAEILAHETAKKLKLPCCDTLIKTKSTKRQVGLTGQKRRQNLAGVFTVTKSLRATIVAKQSKVEGLRGKKILIIDDITTTGTTLNECAKVLKTAGAKEVWGLVVARG